MNFETDLVEFLDWSLLTPIFSVQECINIITIITKAISVFLSMMNISILSFQPVKLFYENEYIQYQYSERRHLYKYTYMHA